MIQWNAEKLRYFIVLAERNIAIVKRAISEKGRGRKLDSENRKSIQLIIDDFKQVCRDAEMKLTLDACIRATNRCSHPSKELYAEDLETLLEDILNSMTKELHAKKFCYIPESKAVFFEQEKAFGETVFNDFADARQDIKDASNCIAADLNTAAVFHLMRVVELGLRKLAADLKAKTLIKKLKPSKIPIELGTWEEIIVTLEAKLDELRKQPRTTRREERIENCNELLKEFRSVKDLWRNRVMHTRAIYDANQAQGAFKHVCNFIQKLSKTH